MQASVVAPAGAVPLTAWVDTLSRRAAAAESVEGLLSARRLLDVFGTGALSALSGTHPNRVMDEQWLLDASAEESTGGDGDTCWVLTLDPGQEPAASVKLTPQQSEGIADRELLALAAVAVGTAQRALVLARKRAGARIISGRPLIELQSAGHRLARAAALIALARAHVRAVCRDEDAGTGAGHRATACAAGAAEAAFACSQALVQIYGAAGTSDAEATAAFAACQSAASAAGPPARLWLEAGRRRALHAPADAQQQVVPTC